ncbi:MAG: hypothetical protein AAF416_14535 [Pseudomonadota bacterium]
MSDLRTLSNSFVGLDGAFKASQVYQLAGSADAVPFGTGVEDNMGSLYEDTSLHMMTMMVIQPTLPDPEIATPGRNLSATYDLAETLDRMRSSRMGQNNPVLAEASEAVNEHIDRYEAWFGQKMALTLI